MRSFARRQLPCSAPLADPEPGRSRNCGRRSAARTRARKTHIELIASENYASPAVMAAQGSQLTNKYAEGYPGKRYYGGCEFVDVAEQLAIDRVKKLFGAEYANVQPHSGAQANQAVFFATLKPGDTILGMSLAARRAPDARLAGELLRQVVQRRRLRARPDDRADRLRAGRAPRARAQAEADRRRRVGVLARHRLEALSRHRRPRRRLSDGRHGALRRARSPPASIRARSASRTSSPAPRTRRCADRAAASSSPAPSTRS